MRRQRLAFARLFFHRIGGRELAVAMRLTALGPGMQFTGFLNLRPARGTRHRNDLFQGQFLGFHQLIMQVSTMGKCSILLILGGLEKRFSQNWSCRQFLSDFEQK
jgi:hypothetical protein